MYNLTLAELGAHVTVLRFLAGIAYENRLPIIHLLDYQQLELFLSNETSKVLIFY